MNRGGSQASTFTRCSASGCSGAGPRLQLLYLAEPLAIVAIPSDQKMAFLDKKVGAIWTAVEKACANESFRPNRGPLCDYCGFKAYCPAFGGDPSLVVATRVPEPVLL